MKTSFTQNKIRDHLLAFSGITLIALFSSCAAEVTVLSQNSKQDKKMKMERQVKIYPDLVKRVMHIRNIEKEEVDFFVFDQEGMLMKHIRMNEGDHRKIAGLSRGAYVYQVFKKDEMSEYGKLKIK
jgi:hypothetical protein